nr:leucine-rich repeat serine/threonine-protein kinase 1 [Hydra vulgaris]
MEKNLGFITSFDGEILHIFAQNNQVDLLEKALIDGTNGNINSIDKEGRTILHVAAKHGKVDCVKLLLKKGANPNAWSSIGDHCSTPLHHAVANGKPKCVAALLEYEINFDLKNSKSKTALDLAKESNTLEGRYCAELIKEAIIQKEIEIEEKKSEVLYDLVSAGDFINTKHILETMKDPYSNINKYYRGYNTLLYCASHNGFKDIVQLLIDYKAHGQPNAENGLTPLYDACFHGYYDVAVLLCKAFPNQLAMPKYCNLTLPLHACVMNNQEHILEYLLTLRKPAILNESKEHQYYVDINKPMGSGLTCLHLAVMYGHVNIIQMLLTCKPFKNESEEESFPGCLVIDKVCDTKTAFHFSLVVENKNSLKCAEMLIQNGADVNKMFYDDNVSYTPLQYVCKNEKVEFIRLLKKYNVGDINGEALNEAIARNKEETVIELLKDGVFINEDDLNLADNECDRHFSPVTVSWKNRYIKILNEKWILNSVLSMNSHKGFTKTNIFQVITHINLSQNYLELVPVIIFQLPLLKKLNLSHNKLSKLPILSDDEKKNCINNSETLSMSWNCPRLEELELQHNLLETLPKNVFEMPALQAINCGNNKISFLPFDMWIAKSLKILVLDNNCLTDLPVFDESAKSSSKFQEKSVSDSQNERENRKKEEKDIDVRSKKNAFATSKEFLFKKRPTWEDEFDDSDEEESAFSKKIGLDKLDLSNNKFTEIPLGLACLAPNLTKLSLNHNQIAVVDCMYLFPENLSNLQLVGNSMKTFNLAEPKNLGCYAFAKRKISKRLSFPNESYFCQHRKHRQLNKLCFLDLSNNALDNISFFVSNTSFKIPHTPSNSEVFCRNLKTLDISNNKLISFPDGIEKLNKLNWLVAYHNKITTLPSELGLCSEIYALQMDSILLKQLPRHIIDNYEDKKIKPLIRHLKSLHDNALPFPNIKLMFVGNYGKGKTSLLTSLRKKGNGSYQNPDYKFHFFDRITERGGLKKSNLSTVGVDICDWKYGKKPIKFSTWDFGGQSEYYATHQCFLSQRAIYLLICRLTDELFGVLHLESWLLNIQARAPNATVIIVGTHADQVDKSCHENFKESIKKMFMFIKNGEKNVDHQDFGLPRVVDVIEVSCTSGYNIQELRDRIYDAAKNIKEQGSEEYNILDQPIPASYIAVEKAVSSIALEMKDAMPVLNTKDFRSKVFDQLRIQKAELKNGVEELNQAVQFLHDYGTLLHFDDPNLNDFYFINPQWFCDLLAHIVTIKSVNPCIKNGVIKISDLKEQIFRGEYQFPSSMVPKYVELLNKFDIAIKIQDEYLLVPSELPDKQKDCIIIAENQSSLLKYPMNLNASLPQAVFRRQYLLTYIPSGLWARLLTRMIADSRISKIVASCCDIHCSNDMNTKQPQFENEIFMKVAQPEWVCWKTGIELSCFGIKLLRVSQLEPEVPFYGSHSTSACVFVKNTIVGSSKRVAIEITAPGITLIIDKFVLNQHHQSKSQDELTIGFCVKSVHYNAQLNACKLFVLTIEHIDTLLAEWYPQLDNFIDLHGMNAVRRVSFCSKCIESAIQISNNALRDFLNSTFSTDFLGDLSEKEISQLMFIHESKKDCIVAFELEQGSQYLNENKDLVCPIHNVIDIKTTFPDLVFLDVDPDYVFNDGMVNQGKFIASGAFGHVFEAEIKCGNSFVSSAMKIPEKLPTSGLSSYSAYKNIRQEVSIILSLHHDHIVRFLGVSSKPFALFLELVPKGALKKCLLDFSSAGKRLTTLTVTESLKQISSALKFLHSQGIIYRDLKCDNTLVRKFPDPSNDSSISQVHLLLTDYGVSRSVFIGGSKGNQGTPGYIAPEISKYTGKEIYSEKVDCFSFGSFIYELLSLHQPYDHVSQMHIIKQNIEDGKRPKLTKTESKYPALILSLLYQCWSHNPDHRPSASEINSLTSLNEFQSLLDILELGKHFHLQCIATSSQCMNNQNLTSSRCQIGSCIWFCGSLNNRPEGVVTVFTYNDFKYNHKLNLQLKEKVLVACPVGGSMWLGTNEGSIKVYCATTLKLIAVGIFFENESILCIEHFPMFNRVIITCSNGAVFYFSDNLDSYCNEKYDNDLSSSIHPCAKIVKLFPLKSFFFKHPIYSMAIVPTTNSSAEFEIWCGQENGKVTILNANTMASLQIISIKKKDLETKLYSTVTFLETPQAYDLFTKKQDHIWIATFRGTQVEKWNVNTRRIENIFYTSQHVVSLTLNCSETSEKSKTTRICDAYIQSVVIVENNMYVGTSSGSFYICDAQTMVPHTWLKCYKELINFIIPFRMKTGANGENEEKLILTCGQNYLDQWWRKTDHIDSNNTSSAEMTVLIWDAKKL